MIIHILVSDRAYVFEGSVQGQKGKRISAKSAKSPQETAKKCAAKFFNVAPEDIEATPPGGAAVNSQTLLGKPRPITGLWTCKIRGAS